MPLPQRPKADSLTTLLKAPWVMAVIALSLLLGALLDARGLGPIAYGVDDDAPDAATDIVRRRYLVRAGQGAWLAMDEAPVPDSARAHSATSELFSSVSPRASS